AAFWIGYSAGQDGAAITSEITLVRAITTAASIRGSPTGRTGTIRCSVTITGGIGATPAGIVAWPPTTGDAWRVTCRDLRARWPSSTTWPRGLTMAPSTAAR